MAVQIKPAGKKASSNPRNAPAQYSQPSRKGKKAWRKNVDIVEIEDGMEQLRDEERVTGSTLHSKTNDDLFQIDAKGDDNIRRSLPKFDPASLSYSKIIAQRSAVAAVYSRPTASTVKKRHLTLDEKNRLLSIGKRKQHGPLNSFLDPKALGNGSASLAPSHAVKKSGTYDVWTEESAEMQVDEDLRDVLTPHMSTRSVKKPVVPLTRTDIDVLAISQPHPGTSYKPTTEARSELMLLAHEKVAEEERQRELALASKESILTSQNAAASEPQEGEVYLGMKVDEGEADSDAAEGEDMDTAPANKPSVKKTKQQRRKAERQKEEKRMLLERAAKKRETVESTRTRSKAYRRMQKAKEAARLRRKAELAEKLKTRGLSGQKIGKHIVPEEKIDVQLSDEVSDSLRGMKVEGNLFRDRFMSLQRRAIIEPRVPVVGRKPKLRVREIEKHAFKRFK
ncbi:P60-like protein [Schizopora paradoxa]|uniref:Ribosome biogenesis protein NOP53 n=1 Tax=Schizopora paradoxa TaxID=27342 RepID=A0A0H2RXR0_9AGAM|nr:P60-like protein [Schizopora paradoxa]